MEYTNEATFRDYMEMFLNRVYDNQQPLCVENDAHNDVVVLTRDDYDALVKATLVAQNPAGGDHIAHHRI